MKLSATLTTSSTTRTLFTATVFTIALWAKTFVAIRPGMINPSIIASPTSLILLLLMIAPPSKFVQLSKSTLPYQDTSPDLQMLCSPLYCG